MSFDKCLVEALEQLGPELAQVHADKFINFVNAIVTSVDQERVDAALQKAAILDPAQLVAIINQTTAIGDTFALKNAIASAPARATIITQLAKKVVTPNDMHYLVSAMAPTTSAVDDSVGTDAMWGCSNCGIEWQPHTCPSCDRDIEAILQTVQSGQNVTCPHCNAEFRPGLCPECGEAAEYYSEGTDSGGHSDEAEEAEEEFDQEGDYYSQGDDGGGH